MESVFGMKETKSNEDRKAEISTSGENDDIKSNQPSLQKTSKEIWNEFNRIMSDFENSKGINNNPFLKELLEFNQKKWIPSDNSILIDDVDKVFDFIKTEVNGQPTDRSIEHFKTQIVSFIISLAKQKLKIEYCKSDKAILIKDVEKLIDEIKKELNYQINQQGCVNAFVELEQKLKSLSKDNVNG